MHSLGTFTRRNGKNMPQFFIRRLSAVRPSREDTSRLIREFEEISITVPWGHIAAKWYGPKNVRPIVGLHGWQDNAGTFDTLAPLLPRNIGFLSLDLPGHGRSSWLPPGMSYHAIDNISILLRIMDTFNWDKISLICHSMSSINGFAFCAYFPEKVDMIVGLDALKPGSYSSEKTVDLYKKCLKNNIFHEKSMKNLEPPCYEWHGLVDRLHHGSKKSVNIEACKYILNRGIQPSLYHPQKYYFSRDNRLKHMYFYLFSDDVQLEMARRIRSPFLFIKALQSYHKESQKSYAQVLDILQRNHNFEYHNVEGTHHVHLNDPKTVAPIVNSFIEKWRVV